jgi:hypothetical protein
MYRNLGTLVLFLALLIIVSCARQTGEIKAILGQEFKLPIGQTAAIASENLTIRFLEVVSDSRCPLNVTCIWEGRASSLIQFSRGNASDQMVLTESGSNDQTQDSFLNYRVTFHLEPYPGEVKNIPKKDYWLQLAIIKQ